MKGILALSICSLFLLTAPTAFADEGDAKKCARLDKQIDKREAALEKIEVDREKKIQKVRDQAEKKILRGNKGLNKLRDKLEGLTCSPPPAA